MKISIELQPGDDPEALRRILAELLPGAVATKRDHAKPDHWFLTPDDKRKRRRAAARSEGTDDDASK